MEKRRIAKTHNVKTSPERQVKAHVFLSSFSSILFFLLLFLRGMNAAKDVDLIFVNGNVYTVNEKQPRAEAIAVRDQRIVVF